MKLVSRLEETSASAGLAELLDPAAQHAIVRLFEIEKLNAHADARLDDAHGAKRFELLVFPGQGDADAGVRGQRFAGAHKNPIWRRLPAPRKLLDSSSLNEKGSLVALSIGTPCERSNTRLAFAAENCPPNVITWNDKQPHRRTMQDFRAC